MQQLDEVFHALSDQTRRALIGRLAKRPCKVTELAEPFAMSLPAVSKHLRVLEKAGLVVRSIDGRVHWCSLSAEPLRQAEQWLAHYKSFWEGNLDSLVEYMSKK